MVVLDQGFIVIKERFLTRTGDGIEYGDDGSYLDLQDGDICPFGQNKRDSEKVECEPKRRSGEQFHVHDEPECAARESEGSHQHQHYHNHGSQIFITTIGLVVHSAADGFALGSSAYSDNASVRNIKMVVFLALMLHKCPAAIGLTTFLMHEGLSTKRIAKHLGAFTLSSPVAAILTYYFFVFAFGREQAESSNNLFYVGMFLLLSAGTFLYVAMIHILPEVYCSTETHRPHTHKHLPEDHVHNEEHYPKEIELVTMLLGLALPIALELLE